MGQQTKLTALYGGIYSFGGTFTDGLLAHFPRDSEGVFSRVFFFWKGTCPKFVENSLVLLSTTNQILNATGEIKIIGFFDRS